MLLLCMYMDGIKFQIVGEVWHTFFSLKYKRKLMYDENMFKTALIAVITWCQTSKAIDCPFYVPN